MPLFQNSVVTKQLQSQDKARLVAQWNVFVAHFHNPVIQDNIRNSKEEQYQGEFLIDLFVKVLGYTKNPTPNFTITTEYKNVKDSKKADGAILINDKVKAVIELKGTNTTDLNKIEVQAFGYKNNQPECVYIITSNFEKLRFYIDNATEHLKFNLFNLTEKEFELLYLCLAYENIANDVPKKLKEQSLSKEKDITKALYTDYSEFKRELHQDLVKQNPDFDALELFKKSQKLLDRFLFLFFAEDRGLLPDNSVKKILNQWQQLKELDEYKPLCERYKKYFNYLNTGFKGKESDIFAYNGGLFKPDDILDVIKIDDELLFKHTLKLSEYDFASEVDVNILGHIFENSLNELDEIKAQLEGGIIDKQSTKRKKDGVFYTPKYITKYIVDNTVGKLCMDKKAEINIIEEDYSFNNGIKTIAITKKKKQELLEKLTAYRNWLLQITICDPACGSGAFLNQALDFLIQEHRYIDELQAKLFGDALVLSDVEKSILENNLYGVDLNEESVEIAKLSLWLRTAQPNRKLNDLNNNIKCGNSLIDDPTIAGEKAFNWQKSFPKIFEEKQKKPFHITTAIHDSRTSQRMIDYKVREKRAIGTMPEPQINYLTDDDEMVIAQTIANLVKEQNLNILAFNVCKDHIHIILVCQQDEVNEIVRKIKGRTAREVNVNKEIQPLVQKEGEKSIPLWTQKFGCKEIVDEHQLSNTINYIKTNRIKHNLPDNSNKGFKPLVESISCSYENAFREEYNGGFDVIIGNPPYVNARTMNSDERNFLVEKFPLLIGAWDLYIPFLLKVSQISKNNVYGWIIPNKLLISDYGKKSLEFLISNGLNKIINISSLPIFENVGVYPIILINNSDKNALNIYEIKNIQDFSNLDDFVKKENLFKRFKSFKELGILINSGTTGFEAQKIIPLINENNEGINFAVSGSIDPYKIDISSVSYMKNKYQNPKIKLDSNVVASSKIDFWNKDKVVIAGMTKRLEAYYSLKPLALGVGIYGIYEFANYSPLFLLSILNSNFLTYYLITEFKDKHLAGGYLAINKSTIEELPLVEVSSELQIPFIEKADLMLSLNKDLQEQTQKFQRTLQREFFSSTNSNGLKPIVDITRVHPVVDTTVVHSIVDTTGVKPFARKLQDWYLLSYADFVKELEKQKIKLSLSQKAEWEEYFTTEATKVNTIKTQIEATDRAIDAMVYELYGLSKEEIEIVENGCN